VVVPDRVRDVPALLALLDVDVPDPLAVVVWDRRLLPEAPPPVPEGLAVASLPASAAGPSSTNASWPIRS
jgi:hypothetical protein